MHLIDLMQPLRVAIVVVWKVWDNSEPPCKLVKLIVGFVQ